MKTTDISAMTTKDLVAKYNELTGKSIKKFSSRAAGEKQVLAALQSKVKKEAANTPAAKAKRTAKPKADKPVVDRSKAIAATWKDPVIAAKRAERTHVKVGSTMYRSVKEAFESLGLPLNGHIRFRMELKQHAQLTFNHDGKKIVFHVAQPVEE